MANYLKDMKTSNKAPVVWTSLHRFLQSQIWIQIALVIFDLKFNKISKSLQYVFASKLKNMKQYNQ